MFQGTKEITMQQARTISSTRQEALGTIGRGADGRLYRYGRAGAVNLAAGKLTVSKAVVTNHTNMAVVSGAAGATTIVATLGGTAVTEDQYAGGEVTINDSTGAGVNYKVKGNSAQTSTSGNVKIFLAEPIIVALTTSSKATLNVNAGDGVIVSPSAIAHVPYGVPNVAVTALYYAWFQFQGRCSVLSDGVIGKGSGAIISDAVDGAVEVEVAGTVTKRVGTAIEATVDAKYYELKLELV